MTLTSEQIGARTPKFRHSEAHICEQCGKTYYSNAPVTNYCSGECRNNHSSQVAHRVDIIDQMYNAADWLIVKDATPEDGGGFVNRVSKFSTTHLEAMGYEHSLEEGTIVENVKKHELKVVDYSKMRGVQSRVKVTVDMFLRNY